LHTSLIYQHQAVEAYTLPVVRVSPVVHRPCGHHAGRFGRYSVQNFELDLVTQPALHDEVLVIYFGIGNPVQVYLLIVQPMASKEEPYTVDISRDELATLTGTATESLIRR